MWKIFNKFLAPAFNRTGTFKLCVTLPHMSICTRVVVAVTFEQVDNAPDTETGTERDNEGLKNGDCLFKKCHIVC